MNKLEKLLEPFSIGSMKLKNRIVMPPMATGYCSEMGDVTERLKNFVEERARGGVGLIITEMAPIDSGGSTKYTSLMVDRDERISGLRGLVKVAHQYGAKIAVQICHGGRFASIVATHQLSQSASGFSGKTLWDSSGGGDVVRQLTIEEIEKIVCMFSEAATRVKEAGFDAVEIHGAHGLLLHEFLSPLVNTRTDGYGGSFEGRIRFPVEVLRAIREKVGKKFPIIYRISAEEGVEKGLTIEESKRICQIFEKEGADAIDVSSGTALTDPIPDFPPFPPMSFPRGIFLHYAEEIKKVVNIPVIAVGRINDPALGEEILRQGKADLIGMARGLVADPEVPKKIAEESLEDIRPCIACMTCLHTLFTRRPMECLVNACVGREKEFEIKKARIPKKVMVVGGGPAGMEAARVASMRGHRVILYEKSDRLGGQLNLAIIPPHKQEIRGLINYLATQIEKLGVEIHCGIEVKAPLIEKEKPDELIVATGATPYLPNIPGVDLGNVVTSWDVLSGKAKVSKKVVIAGGGMVGCETAEFLAERGHEITIASQSDMIGKDLEQTVRRYLLKRLENYGVKMLTNAKTMEIKTDQVILGTYGREWSIECDNIILAKGAFPCRDLVRSTKEIFPNFFLIGDALEPRTAKEAIYEGARIARKI
jgi:2,4-dienoyl-CoA reductase-like NADH-dependent reductase (Old Yellow Enzyme family)/thioredoxin reductase